MPSATRASGFPGNRVKALLRDGRPAFGVFATIPSVAIVQIMAASGLDWVLIDMEHGAIDHATAHAMIAATTGTRLVPIVRVAGTSAEHAKRPLDLGAMGINFPMTTRPEDAVTSARAVRYPPAGDRAWGPFLAPFHWGLSMRDYIDTADDEILTVITIEDAGALAHIDTVLATPGIDVAVIGPSGDQHGVQGAHRSSRLSGAGGDVRGEDPRQRRGHGRPGANARQNQRDDRPRLSLFGRWRGWTASAPWHRRRSGGRRPRLTRRCCRRGAEHDVGRSF
jgi:2-keto-3-deoxy-L-rhamnonate aldolase RhmA